jgi:hypothetical protein
LFAIEKTGIKFNDIFLTSNHQKQYLIFISLLMIIFFGVYHNNSFIYFQF